MFPVCAPSQVSITLSNTCAFYQAFGMLQLMLFVTWNNISVLICCFKTFNLYPLHLFFIVLSLFFPSCNYFSFCLRIPIFPNAVSNSNTLLAILTEVSSNFFLLSWLYIYDFKDCHMGSTRLLKLQNFMNDGCICGEIIFC